MKITNKIKILSDELLEFEKRGEYKRALDKIDDAELQHEIDDLDFDSATEMMMRRGSLIGFFGHAHQIPDSQEESKDLLTQARRRYVDSGNSLKVAESENYLGLACQRAGEFSEAEDWCDRALSHEIDPPEFVRLYSVVIKSLILMTSGKFEETLEFCSEHESLVRDFDDPFISGCFNGNLGAALKSLGRTVESIDKFEASREFHRQSKNLIYQGTVENSLALVYMVEGRFGEARTAVNNAIEITEILGDKARKGATLDTRAQICFEEGKFKEALEAVNEALEILKDGENTAYLTEAYFTKAKILVLLDDVATATLYLMKATELARTNVGVKTAEKLAREFEIAVRKKSIPKDLQSNIGNKIYEGEMELILPPALANYDDYQVVRIKNSHLEEIGIEKNSLAVVVSETIKRGDLVALTEIANDSIICGFYDYFAGIVSISGINSETHLFKTEEVKVVGKIIGVGNSQPGPDGKIYVRPIEI